jgi:hypothetical protein
MIWVVLWLVTPNYAVPITRFPTAEAGMVACLANARDVSRGLTQIKPAPLDRFTTMCVPVFVDMGRPPPSKGVPL